MTQVKIYQKSKSPTQSGKGGNVGKWVVEYLPINSRYIEPVMGWTAAKDSSSQLKIYFDSLSEAKNFASKRKLSAQIIPARVAPVIKKSYSSNFQ